MGREAGLFVRSAGIAASCINTGVDFSWDRGSLIHSVGMQSARFVCQYNCYPKIYWRNCVTTVGFCCEAILSPTALLLALYSTHHSEMKRHFWIHAVSRRHSDICSRPLHRACLHRGGNFGLQLGSCATEDRIYIATRDADSLMIW